MPTVFDIEFLLPYVLPMAIFIVILEVLLGVFLLIGLKKEFTVYSLFAMIVFFTFLQTDFLDMEKQIFLNVKLLKTAYTMLNTCLIP